MAIGTLAQIGLSLIPTAANLGANLFGNKRKSKYEQSLNRMADMFESEASKSVTDNREFKSGMKLVDKRDRKTRSAIDNRTAVTGGTNESRMSMVGSANESRDSNINRLLQNAQRYRQLMMNRAIQVRGMGENARQFRNNQFGQKVNNIVQPLGQATNAFMMSKAFNNTPQKPKTPFTVGDHYGGKDPLDLAESSIGNPFEKIATNYSHLL